MSLKITVDTRESVELFHEICRTFPDVEFERKKLDDGDYLGRVQNQRRISSCRTKDHK